MKVVNFRQRSAGDFFLAEEDVGVARFVVGEHEARRSEPVDRVDGYSSSVASRRWSAGFGVGSGGSVSSALRVSSEVRELISATPISAIARVMQRGF